MKIVNNISITPNLKWQNVYCRPQNMFTVPCGMRLPHTALWLKPETSQPPPKPPHPALEAPAATATQPTKAQRERCPRAGRIARPRNFDGQLEGGCKFNPSFPSPNPASDGRHPPVHAPDRTSARGTSLKPGPVGLTTSERVAPPSLCWEVIGFGECLAQPL